VRRKESIEPDPRIDVAALTRAPNSPGSTLMKGGQVVVSHQDIRLKVSHRKSNTTGQS